MKILINSQKASFVDNIVCLFGFFNSEKIIISKYSDIIVYELKTFYKFLLRKECKKIIKRLSVLNEAQLVFTETVDNKTKEYFNSFSEISLTDCIINNIKKIILYEKHSSRMKNNLDIVIYSVNRDDNIFRIIDNIKDTTNVLSVVTNDDNFFDEISEYALYKYGISTNIKMSSELKDKDFAIVLNVDTIDFSKKSNFTIDIYMTNEIVNTNLLADFSDKHSNKLNDFEVKKAFFVEETDNLMNLKWKFTKKRR